MRFDWYAATIPEEPDALVDMLSAGLGATVATGVARHGYERGYDLKRDGSTVARVLAGGRNGQPHAWASSDDTDAFVRIVRSLWPTHKVSRFDAAEDFDGDGTWNRLYGVCLELADDRRLSIDQAGDWHRLEAGRTFYVGGRKSAVFGRLYEKGKQLRGMALDGGKEISTDLCRLEVQVRPEGISRLVAATVEPEGALGFADWTTELGRRVFGLDVERVHIKERRESDDARALAFLVRQYGAHLERLAERVGGWDYAGRQLEREYRAQQQRREGF